MPSAALQGMRVVVTRASDQASTLASLLQERGAIPVALPMIKIEPPDDPSDLDRAIDDISRYHWVVFTSINAVKAVADRMAAGGNNILQLNSSRVAAIGASTASALTSRGVEVAFVPSRSVAEAVAQEMVRNFRLAGTRIFVPQAQDARDVLVQRLVAAGARVDRATAYRTVLDGDRVTAKQTFAANHVDAVTLTSSSTARNLVSLLEGEAETLLSGILIASIGPITTRTARELGLAVAVEAIQPTVPALVDALEVAARSVPARIPGGRRGD